MMNKKHRFSASYILYIGGGVVAVGFFFSFSYYRTDDGGSIKGSGKKPNDITENNIITSWPTGRVWSSSVAVQPVGL